ncbi:hypothetical protein BKA66DRAFT_416021 [Pyrenochaeta sp. MPI-SDFR-AT-0127]|nr:hypothetical protein BKA66DRAFT_416021 [Pyrenochaeta sp. MPI-SDFR-AT-0127]
MYAPQYPTQPPGYGMPYDYHRNTPPMSPGPGASSYYSPRHGPQATTPRSSPKVHAHHGRRASTAVPQYSSYASPRGGAMPSYGAEFTTPRTHATPRGPPDFVSYFGYSHASRHRRDTDVPPLKRSNRERKRRPSQSARYHTRVVYDDGYGYECNYDVHDDYPPPPYSQHARHDMYGDADRYYYDQVPIYESEQKSSRPRRASHSTRPQPAAAATPKKPAPTSTKATAKATEEDARNAGIPAGYSYKNWDPTEEPIMLLGSVFDANSLGKWIYDWTVFHYGPATPLAEMAGELWLLLIQLAGKVKRAEETIPKIRKKESHEMVEDFLESGARLWIRFAKLLKVCEDYMWKAAKKESGEKKPVSMGKNSGREFVESIFGRDRELEKTEKLMTGMRLWSMRFDANCEDILRHPSA